MAYRLPTERKDRSHEQNTTSYLDDFLERIESLPNDSRSIFAEIYNLEEKISTIENDAQNAANEAIRRAQAKGVPIENVRRQYHEFIHLQAAATELSDKKIDYVTNIHDNVVDAISQMDAKLIDFETQLKKEGRWPNPVKNNPSNPKTIQQNISDIEKEKQQSNSSLIEPTIDTNLTTTNTIPTTINPPTRTINKSRRRESTINNQIINQKSNPNTTRTNTNNTSAKSPIESKDTDIIMTEPKKKTQQQHQQQQQQQQQQQETIIESADTNALDKTLYCTCRRVSFGQMIGCENSKCPIEWYHFECVGLTEEPKGVWYCPQCVNKMKRKSSSGRRKH